MTVQILHGFQIHPDKTLAGCAAQDALIGIPAAVLGTFWPMQQTQRYIDFPIDLAEGLRQRGQLYMHTWSAMDLTVGKGWPVADVLAGVHNPYLHRQAKLLAAWGHPCFVRLDHEFSWKGSPFYQPGPDFVALWRHIVDLFRSDGATNVTWVWCPNQINKGVDLSAWYPGDEYADWTGVDTYNWAGAHTPASRWLTFAETLADSYDALLKIAPTKPIFLAEWASDDRGGNKVAWLRDALTSLPARFPAVAGFLYYPCVTKLEHWPLTVADGTIATYTAGIAAGPYARPGFPMPPDLQPIVPLQAVSAWGDPMGSLKQQLQTAATDASVTHAALDQTAAELAIAQAASVDLEAEAEKQRAVAQQVTTGLDALRDLSPP